MKMTWKDHLAILWLQAVTAFTIMILGLTFLVLPITSVWFALKTKASYTHIFRQDAAELWDLIRELGKVFRILGKKESSS